MLIATSGGHLTELLALAHRLPIDRSDMLWVSVASEQSRSELAGANVVWARHGHSRDVIAFVAHLRLAMQMVSGRRFDVAVSTGASLAPPFFMALRRQGVPCHFIESATRVDGPSLTGRLSARIPGVHLYSQHRSWATGRWHYGGSVFDPWHVVRGPARPLRRALVTTGTTGRFPFRRMVDAAAKVLPPECEVVWQVGDYPASDLPGQVVRQMSADDMQSAIRAADVVISHAGTGSAITALENGRRPVLIPRSAAFGEHVDNHQYEMGRALEERGLAIVREPAELTHEDLLEAAASVVEPVPPHLFEFAS